MVSKLASVTRGSKEFLHSHNLQDNNLWFLAPIKSTFFILKYYNVFCINCSLTAHNFSPTAGSNLS